MSRTSASGILLMLILVGLGIVILIDPHPPHWVNSNQPAVVDIVRLIWSQSGAAIAILGGIVIGSLSIRASD